MSQICANSSVVKVATWRNFRVFYTVGNTTTHLTCLRNTADRHATFNVQTELVQNYNSQKNYVHHNKRQRHLLIWSPTLSPSAACLPSQVCQKLNTASMFSTPAQTESVPQQLFGHMLLLSISVCPTVIRMECDKTSSLFAKPSMSDTEYREYVLNTCTDRISSTTTRPVFTAEVVQLFKLLHQTTSTFSML